MKDGRRKQILFTGITGITAALLMFAGDMLLYYTAEPIVNFEDEIVGILGTISQDRLRIGGLIGPFAAFLYIVGFYQIYLAIKPEYEKRAKMIFALLSLGIIYGGAFHSHFTHLGIMSFGNHTQALELAEEYSILNFAMMFIPSMIAYLTLTFLILTDKTYYPKWIVLFSPIVLFWLSPLMQMLPQPYMMIIAGGWSNIICMIFFSVSTVVLLKRKF